MTMAPDTFSYVDWVQRRERRERLIRYVAALAMLVLPLIAAWVVVGWWLS